MHIPKALSRRAFLSGALPLPAVARAAVRGDEAMYVGGSFQSIPDKTEGKLDMSAESALKFTSKKGQITIPCATVESIEHGQKAGRRVGMAVAITPLALFSKKRKHYVTIGFVDEAGKKQGVALGVGKGMVRSVLTTLETRSGKRVGYESEDAKKHLGS